MLISYKEMVALVVLPALAIPLSSQQEYQTVVPFVLVMLLLQQLNKQGFILGQVVSLFQMYFSSSVLQAMSNLIFGLSCQVAVTKTYIPHELRGYGFYYLAGYVCYLTLGVLSLGMFLSTNDIPYTTTELHYLAGIALASVLMASGLTSSWAQWLGVTIIGLTQSWQFLPLIPVCLYGWLNWSSKHAK